MNDQEHSKVLLQLRETDHFVASCYKRMIKAYIPLIILLIGVIYVIRLDVDGINIVGYALLGALLGILLRDYGWVLAQKKNWPFSLRVINWDTIESIAGTEPQADQVGSANDIKKTKRTLLGQLWFGYSILGAVWLTITLVSSYFMHDEVVYDGKASVIAVHTYVWDGNLKSYAHVRTDDGDVLIDVGSDIHNAGDEMNITISKYRAEGSIFPREKYIAPE